MDKVGAQVAIVGQFILLKQQREQLSSLRNAEDVEMAARVLLQGRKDGEKDALNLEANPSLKQVLRDYLATSLSGEAKISFLKEFDRIYHALQEPSSVTTSRVDALRASIRPDLDALRAANDLGAYNRASAISVEERQELLRTFDDVERQVEEQLKTETLPPLTENSTADDKLVYGVMKEVLKIEALTKAYGRVMPISGGPLNSDQWCAELQDIARGNYLRRVEQHYSRIRDLERDSNGSVDLAQIAARNLKLWQRTGAVAFIEREKAKVERARAAREWSPGKTVQEMQEGGGGAIQLDISKLSDHGIDKILSPEEIRRHITPGQSRDEATMLRDLELSLAQQYPDESQIPSEVLRRRQKLAESVRRSLGVEQFQEFTAGIATAVEKIRRDDSVQDNIRRTVLTINDSAGVKDNLERVYGSGAISDERIVVGIQHVLLEHEGKRLRKLGQTLALSLPLQEQLSAVGDRLQFRDTTTADKLSEQGRQQLESLKKVSSRMFPEGSFADAKTLQEVRTSTDRLLLEQLRKEQIIAWIGENKGKSWTELDKELKSAGAYSAVTASQAKASLVAQRSGELMKEIAHLSFEKGTLSGLKTSLVGDDEKFGEADKKYTEIEKALAEKLSALKTHYQDLPELWDKQAVERLIGATHHQGFKAFNQHRQQVLAQAEENAIREENEKTWFGKRWDNLKEAAKAGVKFSQAVDILVGANIHQVGAGLYAAIEGKDGLDAAANAGARFIQNSHKSYRNTFGVSALGEGKIAFENMGLMESLMTMNPLAHLGDATLNPLLNTLEDSYDTSARHIYNYSNNTNLQRVAFNELQKTDTTLRNAKRAYYAVETVAAIYATAQSGGAAGDHHQGGELRLQGSNPHVSPKPRQVVLTLPGHFLLLSRAQRKKTKKLG